MHRLVIAALILPLAHLGCAAEATMPPDEGENVAAERTEEGQEIKALRGTFCLPGEKVSCTLGPPPVCHCEGTSPPPKRL